MKTSEWNHPILTSCRVQVVLGAVAFRGVGIRQRGEVLRDAEHFPAADLQIIPLRFGHICIASVCNIFNSILGELPKI